MVLPNDDEPPFQSVAVTSPSPTLLQQAVAAGNTELARDLIVLEREYKKDRAREAFDEAIAAAKAEIPPIIKNREAHNSKYADFAAIAKVVDPIISQHGLSYRFRTRQDERIHVTCVLSHKLGHSEENNLSGPADTSGSKNAIQAIGSTLTYLQRYTLVQALGLAVSNDDDGKAAGNGEPVSAEQIKVLNKLINESVGLQRFLDTMKLEKVEDLPARDFEKVKKSLEKKKEPAAKQEKAAV